MAAGVSIWWATPADPERHFADAELIASDRYHDRVRRVGLIGLAAKIILLCFAAVVASELMDGGDDPAGSAAAVEAWLDRVGWLGSIISPRVLTGAALTVFAVRLPAIAVDGWFEYRFGHGNDDHVAVPVRWFATTTVTLAIIGWIVTAAASGLVYRLIGTSQRWPYIVIAIAIVGVVGFSVSERRFRHVFGSGEEPIEDAELASRLQRLATPFGLDSIGFATVTADDREEFATPNAYSVGVGANRRVVMTTALLEEPTGIGDFVLSHELTHVAKRHVLFQTVVTLLALSATIAMLAVLGATGTPWSWFGFAFGDPLGLPVTALVVLGFLGALSPITSWISRVQERIADAGAISAVGVPAATEARVLYVATTADLRPPWWARLFAPHPAPAERLEYLARQRDPLKQWG